MKEIAQIRSLSLWIFLVPFIAVNSCLYISVNFHFLENTFLTVDQIGRSGFTIPYLDGSLSISRASRTFPQFLIFKPSMVITAFLLCVYWYKNNILINYFKNTESTKKNSFMIFGILSAVFLIIHSLLLGIEADIKIFKLLRRVVLVSFIIFEIIAQSMLVINFYKLKLQLSDLSNSMILKCKIILVSILIFVALVSIPLLVKSGNVHFKHGLEWNYFIGVILFYLLTNFFWKRKS